AGELVLLEDLHAHAEHPVQRAVAAVGDPEPRALAQKVAQHRLDQGDRVRGVDLAEITHDAPKTVRPVRAVPILSAIRVGDNADLHLAAPVCKSWARRIALQVVIITSCSRHTTNTLRSFLRSYWITRETVARPRWPFHL